MRIVLHIGANKTGTTALQRWFTRNRRQLGRQGVLWPETGLRGQAHYALSDGLGFGLPPARPFGPDEFARARGAFVQELARSGASAAVISSEFFVRDRPVEPVGAFLEGLDVTVVVFLRRHDEWWPSHWSQAIRTVENPPWGRSFESYLEFQRQRSGQRLGYRALVEAWEAVFPGRVVAVPHDRLTRQRGMVRVFLEAAGLGEVAAGLPAGDAVENASPRVDALSLIDMLQRARRLDPAIRSRLIARAIAHGGVGQQLQDFVSGRLRRRLIAENAADYAFLAGRLGCPERPGFFVGACPEDDGRDGPHVLPPVAALEFLLGGLG